MSDSQLADLKQFITAMLSQTEERLRGDMEGLRDELRNEINELRNETHEGFASIGDAIDAIHEQMSKRDDEVNARLTALEHQAA